MKNAPDTAGKAGRHLSVLNTENRLDLFGRAINFCHLTKLVSGNHECGVHTAHRYMARYSTSAETREALILAAGELFSRHGAEGVSTRAIADAAGENIGSIHYHFGSKEGLLLATLRYCMRPSRESGVLLAYVHSHRPDLADPDRQAAAAAGFLRLYFEMVHFDAKPSWGSALLYRSIQHPGAARDLLMAELVEPDTEAFVALYERLRPGSDRDAALIWMGLVVGPVIVTATQGSAMAALRGEDCLDRAFLEAFRDTWVAAVLCALELS